MIFFSIITPNYNSGECLRRAIDSLISNRINFEHIVIDDVSSDNSFDNTREYIARKGLLHVKLLRNERNLGPGETRNRGLRLAKGEYVVFCDADDYFYPGALDLLASKIQDNEHPDVVVFGYELFDGKRSLSVVPKRSGLFDDRNIFLKDFLEDKIVSAPWGKAIRRLFFSNINFPKLQISEDAIFNLMIFNIARSCLYLAMPLYFYDKSGDSLTCKVFTDKEALKIYRGWIFFERCFARLDMPPHYRSALVARRFRFCAVNFITRIAQSQSMPGYNFGPITHGIIVRAGKKDKALTLRILSIKERLLVLLFLLSPTLALFFIRLKLAR